MSESKYRKNLVRKPTYELDAGNVKGRQNPTMTLMSSDLVPGSNTYIEVGWVWEIPEPNPHILKHSHSKYNEIVIHMGSDPNNPDDLGAEIEFTVGGEPLLFDQTSAIFVPAGVTHGPVIWKKVRRPHLQMAIMLGAGTLAEADPGGHRKKQGTKTIHP